VFLFQAEDGIRDRNVTGVQTCALPISHPRAHYWMMTDLDEAGVRTYLEGIRDSADEDGWVGSVDGTDCFYVETYTPDSLIPQNEIGRASCRDRAERERLIGAVMKQQ